MAPPPLSDGSPTTRALTDYDAVLFDLDGVLTPTADIHEIAWRETFEEVLPELAEGENRAYRADDYILHIDGRPRFEGVQQVLAAHRVELPRGSADDSPGSSTVSAIGNLKNTRFLEILERDSIEPYPGSLRVLDHLEAAGVPMAVVSSSKNAKRVLEAAGLTQRFPVVVDGQTVEDEGIQGKPSPDPFLSAADKLGVAPAEAVVIEDALSGVRSGRDGSFALVVGVARDGDVTALSEAGADIVVTDLAELL